MSEGKQRMKQRTSRGFTLIEMMIVVRSRHACRNRDSSVPEVRLPFKNNELL